MSNDLPDIFKTFMNIAREIQKNCIKFIKEQTIENNLLLVKLLTFGII
jgi:hypothetical protein